MKGTVKRLCYYWLQRNSGMKNEVCQTASKIVGLKNSEFHLLKKYGLSFL